MRLLLLLAALMVTPTSGAADQPSPPSRASMICGGVSDASEFRQCMENAHTLLRDEAERSTRNTPYWVSWIWPVGWWLVYYGFGLIIGGYVYRDAKKREWVFLGIPPIWWMVLILFDPALGILAYWAAHYSKLAQTYSEATAQDAKT